MRNNENSIIFIRYSDQVLAIKCLRLLHKIPHSETTSVCGQLYLKSLRNTNTHVV